LSQVPAITNETPIAPEPSNIQRSEDNFLELLEKEKLKTLFPPMLPVNFQSFLNTPLPSGRETDKAAGKIERFFAAADSSRQNPFETSGSNDTTGIKEQKQEQPVKTAETSKEAKAEQIKFTANAINRTFAGELELSTDFYNALINAKNSVTSLRRIDVDDLIAQIKDKIKFLSENGKIELSIELKPENMGTILMSISSNKGVLSINIYADQAAKQALEENIAELERSLKQADLYVEDLRIFSEGGNKHNKGETG
jgi:flagellar hook-length control protein FliK